MMTTDQKLKPLTIGRFLFASDIWDWISSYLTYEANIVVECFWIYFFSFILMIPNIIESSSFRWTHTALVTPFTEDSTQIDYQTLRELIEYQTTHWVQWVVPMGTTGESPTVTQEEHIRVIAETVEQVRWRILVIAGAWSNNTKEAILYAREAEHVGADALLSVVPYYNKPNQEWIYRHFSTQAQNTSLPIILYSIPGRSGTGIELHIPTIIRLAKNHPNIVGIKEAGWSLERFIHIRQALDEAWLEKFVILSGDDVLTIPTIQHQSSDGVISVASNILPHEISNMVYEALHRDIDIADRTHQYYLDLFNWLFMPGEPNPQVTKYVLSQMNQFWWRFQNTLRLPLIPISPANEGQVNGLMRQYRIS